ncbi:MAG: hypothetical protein U0869_23575, partial [Chloroflexota bacterium]
GQLDPELGPAQGLDHRALDLDAIRLRHPHAPSPVVAACDPRPGGRPHNVGGVPRHGRPVAAWEQVAG